MDTSTLQTDSTISQLRHHAAHILNKVFGPLYKQTVFSPEEILLAGDLIIERRDGIVSPQLSAFLQINQPVTPLNCDGFLSLVAEEDRRCVSRWFTLESDEFCQEGHFFCKVRAGNSIKTLVGLKQRTDGPDCGKFCITFFDIPGWGRRSVPVSNAHQINLSSVWFSDIFQTKAAGIIILNESGEFLKANQKYQDLSGRTDQELCRMTFLDMIPVSDWDASMRKMGNLFSGDAESVNFENRLIKSSGELCWIEIHASTTVKHNTTYVLCFVTDIHIKKQAEEKLKASEERLHQAQSIAKIGSWGMDLTTKVISWSRGMYDLMELPYDYQPTIDAVINLIHPDDRDLFRDKVSGDQTVSDLEVRHLTPSGVKLILVNTRLDYEDGMPVRYHGTSQDVSERWTTDAKFDLIQQTARLGWYEINLLTGDTVWSDSMYEIYGLDKKTTTPGAEAYFKAVHPDDKQAVLDAWNNPEVLKSGWNNEELRHVMPDGSIKYLLTSGNSMMDGDRPVKLIGTMMDISSAKETQIRLEEAQRIARFGWWETDLRTGKTSWSDFYYDLLDQNIAEGPLAFDEFIQRVHPEDRHFIYRDPKTLRDGWTDQEMRYLKKSGGINYVLSSGRVVFNGDEPVKIMGTNMDITSLKETQLKLEQAQQIAHLGWWEFDLTAQGDHWYSPEFMEIFEISGPDAIKSMDDFVAFIHPEDVQLTKSMYKKALKAGKWDDLVTRIRQKGEGYKYIKTNVTIKYIDDQPVRLFGSVYDVSNFKEIEKQLERNLVNLEAMVASMDSLVVLIDDQLMYREVFCSDFSKLGFDPHDLIGQQADKVLVEQFQADELLRQYSGLKIPVDQLLQMALKGIRLEPIEFKLFPAHEYWWEIKIHSFLGQDGKRWIAFVVNDITARKTAEEELVKSVQKEKELTDMRTQFVSMASHQFRTPLTVIKSNMQLLELSNVKDPVVDRVKGRLQTEVDRLVHLMEDIMAMGKVQSSSVAANLQPVKVSSLIKQVKMNLESQQADRRSLKVTVFGKERLVKLDARFIEQALHNLIDNAFKYSPGAPDPEVRIAYCADKLRISVIDEGIGIPQEDRPKLFTSFQRGSNSRHIAGTGLGLAVTREFVRLNNGTIFFNTKRKGGTEFCIDIPYNE